MNDQGQGGDNNGQSMGMNPGDPMGSPSQPAPMGQSTPDNSYNPAPGSPVQEPVAQNTFSPPPAQPQPMPSFDPQPQHAPDPGKKMPDVASIGPSPRHVAKIEQMLIFIYVAIASLILVRFLLSLFGANRKSPFVDFVYSLSSPFMVPFDGMFGRSLETGRVRIEFESIVAVVIYALIFYGLVKLVRIILR